MWNSIAEWDDEGWRDRAACRNTDATLFFPPTGKAFAAGQVQAAKLVCRSCRVSVACLQFALDTNQEAGVWGGKDEDERQRLRRAWRAKGRPPVRSLLV